jgi:hypothetical protein
LICRYIFGLLFELEKLKSEIDSAVFAKPDALAQDAVLATKQLWER